MTNAEARAVGLVVWLIIGIIVAHRCRRSSIGDSGSYTDFHVKRVYLSTGFYGDSPVDSLRFGWHLYRDRVDWGVFAENRYCRSGWLFYVFP